MPRFTPRELVSWSFAIAVPVLLVGGLYFLFMDLRYHAFPNLTALLGIKSPILQLACIVFLAAIPATFVALLLPSSKGALKLSLLGIRLSGPAGPVLLWVVTFLAASFVMIALLRLDQNNVLWR